ncbi:hypothetical protein QNH46_24265 [Paenibacillus woosongensis]|uniref:Uncharacterized protein n=1 Tax=Paenibacillus woosongensis TaxID=307580 RepID=A0AA95I433_9BACL|nr:hypothetical protein [Paenibacillus woosongensis]WHX49116.1 hypothetical protein QNH46_24265 [Paenibacillus woosongensis]
MEQRNLIECTIDVAQRLSELTAVISAVLGAVPDVEARLAVLQALNDEITTALFTIEDEIEGGDADDSHD